MSFFKGIEKRVTVAGYGQSTTRAFLCERGSDGKKLKGKKNDVEKKDEGDGEEINFELEEAGEATGGRLRLFTTKAWREMPGQEGGPGPSSSERP